MPKMRVVFGKTINTGNYESIKVSVEVEEDFSDAINYSDTFEDIFMELEEIVDRKEKELRG